jgi:ferredoxin
MAARFWRRLDWQNPLCSGLDICTFWVKRLMAGQLFMVRFEPSGVTVAVSPGTSLFDAAHRARFAIPSICGGQGDCGECRVAVLEGDMSPLTQEEENYLDPAEVEVGMRLACCARVRSSARIRLFFPDA